MDKTDAHFLEFSLKGDRPEDDLLPEGCKLTVNTVAHIVTLVEADSTFSEQVAFPPAEYDMFLVLLSAYPHYAPREAMLSAYSGRSIEECRERIRFAEEEDNIDIAMASVRNVLSRSRMKMRMFGIDALPIVETGYILMKFKKRFK